MNIKSRRRQKSMVHPTTVETWLFTLFLVLALPNLIQAKSGDLDDTFGAHGKVLTDLGSQEDNAIAVMVQPDGKIVVGGSNQNDYHYPDFVLARYNSDGSLDTDFGTIGKTTTDFGGIHWNEIHAIALQPDGKILAAGMGIPTLSGDHDFALARYNSDGSPDMTFGVEGKITTDISGDDAATALSIQPDGKIIVGGSTNNRIMYNAIFALVRYNSDGSLDATFGADGIVTTDVAYGPDSLSSLALQTDGKIVAAGTIDGASFGLVRYNPDGSLDTRFGAGGKATVLIADHDSPYDEATALTLQPDGKILTAGFGMRGGDRYGESFDIVIARFNNDGSLDDAFGSMGRVFTDLDRGTHDKGMAISLQPNGKIVVAGSTYHFDSILKQTRHDFALARYHVDGAPDVGFGSHGQVITEISDYDNHVNAIALQRDGKIVAAGQAFDIGSGNDLALARYLLSEETQKETEEADTAPPVTTALSSPGANAFGWNNTNVTVSLSGEDGVGGSGVKEIHYRINSDPENIVSGAFLTMDITMEGTSSVEYYAIDIAGNKEAPRGLTIKIDKTPPAIVSAQEPSANAAGWNNTDVTVHFTATDALSGGVRCAVDSVTVTAEGAHQIQSGVCSDLAGNSGAASRTVNIDKTAPVITASQSPAPNAKGWNNTDVTVSFTASDNLSGGVHCTVDSKILRSEGSDQSITTSCSDLAGNSAGMTQKVKIDKTAPTLILPSLSKNYVLNKVVTFDFGTKTDISGVASISATLNGTTVSSGAAVTLDHLGANTFSLTAIDNAGNIASQKIDFTVGYQFSCDFPSSTEDDRGAFHQGSVVPIKFQLHDADGKSVSSATIRLSLQKYEDGNPVGNPIDLSQNIEDGKENGDDDHGSKDTGKNFSGNRVTYDGKQYLFNIDTQTLSKGPWEARMTLDDGSTQSMKFELK